MAVIRSHPRGIAVIPGQGDRPSEIGRRLRQCVGVDQVLTIRGRFVIPNSCAAAIADEFGPDEARWDDSAWAVVMDHRRRLETAEAARVGIEAALARPEQALGDYGRLGDLDAHQVKAVAAISVVGLPGFALFDEQGAGKTISVLAAFDHLYDQAIVRRLLVVAPKSVLSAWTDDLEKFLQGKYQVVVVTGPAARRRQLIRGDHDILLVTYDGLARDRIWLETRLASEPRAYMLVADESYMVKNKDTARAWAVSTLRPYCERAVVLCGTPAPNSARDVVSQIDLADDGLTFGNVSLPADHDDARDVIREALGHAPMLRRLKEEVYPDIPGKVLERLYVELSPVQRAAYDQVRRDLIQAVRRIDQREFVRKLSSFLAQRAALLQICSHPGVFDTSYSEEPAKFAALDYLIEELLDKQDLKLVIWSFYRFSLSAIADRYASLGLVRIDGTVQSSGERAAAIRRFQGDPKTRIFLGNPAAAGAGITLTAAHHVAYESFSNQTAHYLQSMDRVHRRGQRHEVVYHVILAQGTVEEVEFDRLLGKERLERDLLGDHRAEAPTREQFLTDLGAALD